MAKYVFNASVFEGAPLMPASLTTVVTVTNKDTGVTATIWEDEAGDTPKANPFNLTVPGELTFYANEGKYRIRAVNGIDELADWDDEVIGPAGGGGGSNDNTGLLDGGGITVNTVSTFTIAAGNARIVDDRVPTSIARVDVSFSETNFDVSALANDVYYAYVDDGSTVQLTATVPDAESFRYRVYLWRVPVVGGQVLTTASIAVTAYNTAAGLHDLGDVMGLVKKGLEVIAAGATLSFGRREGVIYDIGANYFENPASPNLRDYALTSPVTFTELINGSLAGNSPRDTIRPGLYFNGTSVVSVPGSSSRATIHIIVMFPNSAGLVLDVFPDAFFADIDTAYEAITTGAYFPEVLRTDSLQNAIILGAIIVQSSATSLADGTQVIVPTNKFGGFGGSPGVITVLADYPGAVLLTGNRTLSAGDNGTYFYVPEGATTNAIIEIPDGFGDGYHVTVANGGTGEVRFTMVGTEDIQEPKGGTLTLETQGGYASIIRLGGNYFMFGLVVAA